MLKSFKFRLKPNKEQSVLLTKHIGSARFIYNLALETKEAVYSGRKIELSSYDLHKQLKDLKNECEWLKEVNAQSLQQSIHNLDKSFKSFFKGNSSYPKYKKKSNKGSFNIPQDVYIKNGKLSIPKFREGIKVIFHRDIIGLIKQATISKTPTGKFFVSILCETGEEFNTKKEIIEKDTVGVDLGIKDFLITSDGEIFENPKFLKNAISKIKYTQRKYSKYKGKRTKKKLSRLYENIYNQRKDFLHKVSTELTSNYSTICIEDLNVSGMMKNRNLSLAISEIGWGMFRNMLEYKCDDLRIIGRYEPSSKMCSKCNSVNKSLKLNQREWKCISCGSVLDRDINASINIKNIGLGQEPLALT